jgi:hypothetical protein
LLICFVNKSTPNAKSRATSDDFRWCNHYSAKRNATEVDGSTPTHAGKTPTKINIAATRVNSQAYGYNTISLCNDNNQTDITATPTDSFTQTNFSPGGPNKRKPAADGNFGTNLKRCSRMC